MKVNVYRIATIECVGTVELTARNSGIYVNGKEIEQMVDLAFFADDDRTFDVVSDSDGETYLIDSDLVIRAYKAYIQSNKPAPPPRDNPQRIYVCMLKPDRFFWIVGTYDDMVNLTCASGYAATREQAESDARTSRPGAEPFRGGGNNRGDGYAREYRKRANQPA